jgi:hypothetical protein
MFNLFKGGKVTMSVALDRPNAPYLPGETVHATVSIQGEKELKIQQGRVALVYTEVYKVRERERDSDDNSTTVNERTLTENKEIRREVFMQEGVIAASTAKTFTFDLQLPADLAPTYSGRIINSTWAVKATLDRKMAPDVNSEASLGVVSPAPGRNVTAGNFGAGGSSGDAELTIWLPKEEWREGETIEGKLIVTPKKDFDVSEVRIELQRIENVPAQEGNTFVDKAVVLKPAGGTKFSAGKSVEYPISMRIPDKGSPTMRGLHGTVVWTLKGILSRRLRTDYSVNEEIGVYVQQ